MRNFDDCSEEENPTGRNSVYQRRAKKVARLSEAEGCTRSGTRMIENVNPCQGKSDGVECNSRGLIM